MTIYNSEPIIETAELRPGDKVQFLAEITGANGFHATVKLLAWDVTERIPIDTVFDVGVEEQDGIASGIGMVIGKKL